jgi:hypothetical protein
MPNHKPNNAERTYDLSVETVFNFFSMLQGANVQRAFLDECEKRGFVLTASAELTQFAKSIMTQLPGLEVAGPECPACPPRR